VPELRNKTQEESFAGLTTGFLQRIRAILKVLLIAILLTGER
jgi:hypothetical protein